GASPPSHDASVAGHRSLRLRIGKGAVAATRRLRIDVRNADTAGSVPIRVTAAGCGPAATVTIDFDPRATGAQDTATVRSGRQRAAIITVSISAASITTTDRHQPLQCELTVSAAADVAGNVDPTPADNAAMIELSALDLNDLQ